MKNCNAITKLLDQAVPNAYSENLTQFWEGYLTNEIADDLSAKERSEKLWFYKNMLKFFDSLEDE